MRKALQGLLASQVWEKELDLRIETPKDNRSKKRKEIKASMLQSQYIHVVHKNNLCKSE
jgi:hypothetical protein